MYEDWIVKTIGGLIIGFISYFLKRTMNRVDKNEIDVSNIKETYVKEIDFDKQQEKQDKQIKEIRDSYTPIHTHEKAYDELRKDVNEVKDQMLKKDDFVREMSDVKRSIEKSQDKMNELFLKYMGGNK